jgi:hypothetical protein
LIETARSFDVAISGAKGMDEAMVATVIEVTAAEIAGELARRGIGSDERVC